MTNLIIFISLALLLPSAHAEVFKCTGKDQETIYQPRPCDSSVTVQKQLSIKSMSPEETEAAEARLKAWEDDLAKREEAELKAKKEQQETLDRQATIDALERSAKAQEEAAKAAKQPVIIRETPVIIERFPMHRPQPRISIVPAEPPSERLPEDRIEHRRNSR
jgi:hypothetical protein